MYVYYIYNVHIFNLILTCILYTKYISGPVTALWRRLCFLVLYHGSLAENRLKETRIMHCTTVDPVWSRSHEDVSHHWHTVGPHGLYIQVMICTQSSPKTWATWHQMRKLCCGEGWPLRLAQAHMGSQSRKVKKDILMISCSTLLVFLFTPAWINRPVRCQVSISIARMARLAT